MYNCVWHFCTYLYSLSLNGCHVLVCIANNSHSITITTHAIKRHFLIWMTTVGQLTKSWCYCVLTLKYTFICVCWWTRQRIHNTLIVADRYLRLMGEKTIPDSAEPRLESLYPHSSQVSIYHIKVWWILIIFKIGIPILVRWHIHNETAPRVTFTNMGLTLIPAWMSNHVASKVWDEINHTFPNFHSAATEPVH